MNREGLEVVAQIKQGWVHGNLIQVVDSLLPALMTAHPVPRVEDPQARIAKLWVRVTTIEGEVTGYETTYYDNADKQVGETKYHEPAELSRANSAP